MKFETKLDHLKWCNENMRYVIISAHNMLAHVQLCINLKHNAEAREWLDRTHHMLSSALTELDEAGEDATN